MKHLKTKLVSAIAMLAVAAIMMTSATYAWFTVSTNPIVKGAEASVTANGNLEIALDNGTHTKPADSAVGDYGKNETWGSTVDVSSFFDDANLVLKPVSCIYSSGNMELTYPVYGTDGRIKRLAALTRVKASSTSGINYGDIDGVAVYATEDISNLTSSAVNEKSSSIYAFEIDYWLRTNKSSAVLELQSSGTATAENMNTGNGSKISLDNVTVYIVMSSAQDSASYGSGSKIYKAVRASDGTLSLKEQTAGTDGKLSDATGTDTTSYKMPCNTEVEVKMFVLMDGAKLTNKDAQQALTDFTLDIQFTVGDLTEMVVTPEA